MSVNFSRVDYAQIGITSRGCLHIIHMEKEEKKSGKKAKPNVDKIVVGGQNGVLVCMERKLCDTIINFKTPTGPPIDYLCMGGALQTIQDKTFIAVKTVVRGFSRKGKQFLNFESNMTEGICCMYIYGVDMFLCGRNSMYHFHDCEEKNSFICSDEISDVLCLPITEGGWVGRGITPVIACSDKTIKVIDGSRLAYEIKLSEIPSVLRLFMNDGGYNKQKVMFGTRSGTIGLVDLSPTNGTICYEIDTKTCAVISALHFYQILDDVGPSDLVIGKEDGAVEIYAVDESDALAFRYSYQCDESITGLECGRISSASYGEIVVCTYSGWVFGLTPRSVLFDVQAKLTDGGVKSGGGAAESIAPPVPQIEVKVQQLKEEVEELERKLHIERDRLPMLGLLTMDENLVETSGSAAAIPIPPPFTVNDKFELNKELACYALTVELTLPIDYVLLQSDVKVELVDVERNSAVVSITHADTGMGNALLAVYRCQADITRMEMRIRSIEGQFGTLRLYVVPRQVPIMCQMRSYPIKALALHERVHDFDAASRPLNVLIFTGAFSIQEAHSWLVFCISQIPERCPHGETVTFNFQSTFNGGTILRATYGKGKATYWSDNLSTIVILRDVISKIVTMRQLKVHISCDVKEESVPHALRLIHPKMEYQSNLVKKLELAKGLKEVEDTFKEAASFTPMLKEVLESYEQLHKEVAEKSIYFDRILGIITDLYIDKFKIGGQNVKHRINELLVLLHDDYSLEKLIEFFNAKHVRSKEDSEKQ